MKKLLVILFLFKLYAQKNVFNLIRGKYGQHYTKTARLVETIRTKIAKLKLDIKFIITCKRDKLIPTFAKPKIVVKLNFRTRWKITQAILDAELQNKYNQKKKLLAELSRLQDELYPNIGYICRVKLNSVIQQTIKGKRKNWTRIHDKKLHKLTEKWKENTSNNGKENPATIIYNYSSYVLSNEEEKALEYGLDTHIPGMIDKNRVKTEFEAFYEDVLKQTNHLNIDEQDLLKSKLRRICESYSNIKVPYQYKECIKKLSSRKDITIMKSDKGRAVVILDKTLYLSKCLSMINTDKFEKLKDDPTKRIEGIVQRTLLTLKNQDKFTEAEYKKIYPSGSNPGSFYGTAKVHKLEVEDGVDKLTFRPIISNVGTATYKLSKYLATFLSPLTKSTYTVSNTTNFVSKLKTDHIPDGYMMLSLDVENLFTNVPLEDTIDIIINKIYREKLLKTKITKIEMRKLLLLCTREVHFTFNGALYKQTGGVAMGSPLGPVLANIFMCELENNLVPKLNKELYGWKRFVDDIFTYADPKYILNIITALNGFHPNIKFKYEFEKDRKIPFLDVLIIRTEENQIETTVYRKPTNTNIYVNWNSYAPINWKYVTAQILIKRAYSICSTENLLEKELAFIEDVLCRYNNYPVTFVRRIVKKEEVTAKKRAVPSENNAINHEQKSLHLHLPYGGVIGEKLVTKVKKIVKNNIPNTVMRSTYNSERLSSRFTIKDPTKFEHRHNVTYYAKCGKKACKENYTGQTKRRMQERIIDHNRRDTNSHLLKHAKATKHRRVWKPDFKIINSNYRTDRHRRISEAFHIRKLGTSLNTQDKSYPIMLFN